MHIYCYRILDRHHIDFAKGSMGMASFVILTNSRGGPPQLDHKLEFLGSVESLGSGMQFRCPVIPLGQWWSRWPELKHWPGLIPLP